MPTIQERLEAATSEAELASGILHDVVAGGPTDTVSTPGGPVPSLKKWFADRSAEYAARLFRETFAQANSGISLVSDGTIFQIDQDEDAPDPYTGFPTIRELVGGVLTFVGPVPTQIYDIAEGIDKLGNNTSHGAPVFLKIISRMMNGGELDAMSFIHPQYHSKVNSASIGDQEDFTAEIKVATTEMLLRAKGGAVPTLKLRPGQWYVSDNLVNASGKAIGFCGSGIQATVLKLRPTFNGKVIILDDQGFGNVSQRNGSTYDPSIQKSGSYIADLTVVGDHSGTGEQTFLQTTRTVDELRCENVYARLLRSSFMRLGDWKRDSMGVKTSSGCIRESVFYNLDARNCGKDGSPTMLITNTDLNQVGDGTNQLDFYKIRLVYPAGNGSVLLDMANYWGQYLTGTPLTRSMRRINFFGLMTHGAYQLNTTPDDENYFDRMAHLIAIRGNVDGVELHSWRANGAGPSSASFCLAVVPIDDELASSAFAQNLYVQGNISNTDNGILLQQGKGSINVHNGASAEALRVSVVAGPGIQPKYVFAQPFPNSALVFIDAAARSKIDLYEDLYSVNTPPASLALTQPSSVTVSSPATAALSTAVSGNVQPNIIGTTYFSGAGTGGLRLRHARNTSTSPQALNSGDAVASIVAHSHDGSAFNLVGSLVIETNEAHSTTNHGTRLIVSLVPSGGSTTLTEVGRWSGLGSLSIGTTTVDAAASFIAGKPFRHIGYTVAALPTTGLSNGMETFATDGLGAGGIVGVPVFRSNSAWRRYSDNAVITT